MTQINHHVDEATLVGRKVGGHVDDLTVSEVVSMLAMGLADLTDGPDYIAALGKVDPSAWNNEPTLYNPTSAVWTDSSWFQFTYHTTFAGFAVGSGPLNATDDPFAHVFLFADVAASYVDAGGVENVNSSDGQYVQWNREVYMDVDGMGVGTGRMGQIRLSADHGGEASFLLGDTAVSILALAVAGQTDPLLNLQDSSFASILEVTGDNKIGFYAASPVAEQTGVAVSDAAIHAALVNLGLITA